MSTVRTVATREFTERARSKAFVFSNIIIVVAIVAMALLPGFFGGGDSLRVAVFDDASATVVALAAEQGTFLGSGIEPVETADRDDAERAVASGRVSAALIDGRTILVDDDPPPGLADALQGPAHLLALDEALAVTGLSSAERQSLLAQEALPVERLNPADEPARDDNAPVVAFVAVMVLYSLLIMYGQWVGQGIVEEKQSRVVEVLLSTVSPLQLLAGKVLGIGLLGLAQITLIASVGSLALLYALPFDVAPEMWRTLGLVLAWYLLGYAIYAALFAAVGAICARIEDFQSAATPVFALIFGAVVGVQFALTAPEGAVARVLSLVPFTAPLVQPMRAAVGDAGALEVAAAVGLGVATVAALVPLAARVYTGGALKTRARVSVREAWGANG